MRGRTAWLALFLLVAWASPGLGEAGGELAVFRSIDEDLSLHGYVDRAGAVVIPARFLRAHAFGANGLARVELDDGTGFIDARGDWVIAPGRFVQLEDFGADGLAIAYVRVGENATLGGAVTTPRNRAGFIDARGAWVIPPEFSDVDAFAANGLARATQDGSGKVGFIGRDGRWRIPPRFHYAGGFGANGLAPAQEINPLPEGGHGPMGYVDATGNWAIPPRPWFGFVFADNGLARVTDLASGKTGYIDSTGAWVLAPEFDEGSRDFGPDGRAVVVVGDYRRPFLVDRNGGRIALPGPVYSDFSAQGLAVAWDADGSRQGLIDGEGRWVLPPEFESFGDSRSPPVFPPNGWLNVQHGGQPRLVNREGGFATRFDAHLAARRVQLAQERAAEKARIRSVRAAAGDGLHAGLAGLALLVSVGLFAWAGRRRSRR